jgi:MFS family permease
VVAVAGFFTNAGVVALYSLAAERFPTEVRATGTGFVIGLGRGGAALSPIVAGLLFEAGVGLQGVAILMSLGATLAAVAILLLRPARVRAEP